MWREVYLPYSTSPMVGFSGVMLHWARDDDSVVRGGVFISEGIPGFLPSIPQRVDRYRPIKDVVSGGARPYLLQVCPGAHVRRMWPSGLLTEDDGIGCDMWVGEADDLGSVSRILLIAKLPLAKYTLYPYTHTVMEIKYKLKVSFLKPVSAWSQKKKLNLASQIKQKRSHCTVLITYNRFVLNVEF